MKSLFDIVASAAGLILLSPVMLLTALLIKLDSRGPVFFKQQRVGKGFRPFLIYKFRTMVEDAPQRGSSITVGADPRITRIGRFLRKTKFDELPQLINVLKGDMSLVGPRPEVPRYVEMFRDDYEEILRVRPGITDTASLKYEDEAEILGRAANAEDEYIKHILPEKVKLAKDYVRRSSLMYDFGLILRTIPKLFGCRARLPIVCR
jgi:lipopolysaccharide/colanic/teichoic acid biosynthesis glycosyltransferase